MIPQQMHLHGQQQSDKIEVEIKLLNPMGLEHGDILRMHLL